MRARASGGLLAVALLGGVGVLPLRAASLNPADVWEAPVQEAQEARGPAPVVHAILFYSSTCPHCHKVITEDLIPLQEQYGRRLVILGFEIHEQFASDLYWEAIRYYKVPEEDWAVPLMLVGDRVLVGGVDIPNEFPGMVKEGLASGGIDLPDFPALLTFLGEQNLLDPRFPDRRVVRQEPAPPEGAGAAGGGGEVAGGAAAEKADTGGLVADTAAAGAAGAQADTGRGEAAAGERTDTAAAAADTAVIAADTAVPSSEVPAQPTGRRPAAPDTSPSMTDTVGGVGGGEAPGGGPGKEGVSPPTDTTRSIPAAGAATPMGLAEAARRMESLSPWDRFQMDPLANALAVLVLLLMVLTLVLRGYPPRVRGGGGAEWLAPVAILVGLAAASYLSFVEVTHAQATCGPVGDCNAVNQSEYARLFGRIPVAVLGLLGYLAALVCWLVRKLGPPAAKGTASALLWIVALVGVVFSAYLTFLEPFVIGATCAWCLTSALGMTVLLWVSAPMARDALRGWGAGPENRGGGPDEGEETMSPGET